MSTISELVARLQVVLASEEEVYKRFKNLLRREETELIELDPRVLEGTVAEKRALAAEARLHEDSRVHLVGALADLLGLEERRPKLSQLIATLGPDAGELGTLHVRLAALITATRSLLDSNERFAQRSAKRVRETLSLLGQAVPVEVGYGPGAARSKATGRGRLVRASI